MSVPPTLFIGHDPTEIECDGESGEIRPESDRAHDAPEGSSETVGGENSHRGTLRGRARVGKLAAVIWISWWMRGPPGISGELPGGAPSEADLGCVEGPDRLHGRVVRPEPDPIAAVGQADL